MKSSRTKLLIAKELGKNVSSLMELELKKMKFRSGPDSVTLV